MDVIRQDPGHRSVQMDSERKKYRYTRKEPTKVCWIRRPAQDVQKGAYDKKAESRNQLPGI